jgi:ribosomal protein S18 acetylase RimI-like enzyme
MYCVISDILIRPATAADAERVAEILFGDPRDEGLALVGGNRQKAIAFGIGMFKLDPLPNPNRPIVVAVDGDEIVGGLQYSFGTGDFSITWDRAKLAIRVLGPVDVVRLLPRLRARERVETKPPDDAFYIAELHIDPARRSQGIGGMLLDWADGEARRRGYTRIALSTTMTNRARHLYERHGYTVTAERTDPKYERYTGIPGRVMLEKELR